MDTQELQRGDLVPRSLNELADAINSEYRQSQALFQKGVTHSRNMGEYLLKVKEQVEHGQWLPWLSANCPDVAERTAQACMRLARNWGTIEGKSATVADLTINEALKLIPLKVDPVSDRYLQWYDHKADEVWGNKIKHVMAFRRVVTYPDIMDRLSTEQILPLAQAVYDEHLRLDRDITEGSIESAVKQRFKETFTKKREEESKHNELVRELRDGAVAFRKSQSAINRVEQLTKNNPDIINKTGFAGLGFIDELSNLNSQLLHKANKKPEKEIFEVLPALPATIEADNELDKLRNKNNGWGESYCELQQNEQRIVICGKQFWPVTNFCRHHQNPERTYAVVWGMGTFLEQLIGLLLSKGDTIESCAIWIMQNSRSIRLGSKESAAVLHSMASAIKSKPELFKDNSATIMPVTTSAPKEYYQQ